MPFYQREELEELLGSVGDDVLIDRTVVLFNSGGIHVESHVRIDYFCVVSAGEAGIQIAHHVHIGAHGFLTGSGGAITLEPFSGLSGRVSIYTISADYSGEHLTNPTVPEELQESVRGSVTLGRHAIVGAGSVIMPGVKIGMGSAVGALSFVNRSVPDFAIVSGNPLRRVGDRSRRLLELERQVTG